MKIIQLLLHTPIITIFSEVLPILIGVNNFGNHVTKRKNVEQI